MNKKIADKPFLSIIITTYNRMDALALVLQALGRQLPEETFEVVVADDGSNVQTKKQLDIMRPRLPYRLKHVWQADDGFRVARIRNQAVAAASGEYLIFLDGDAVPAKNFLRHHLALAARGFFVAGNRILLSQKFTAKVLIENIAIDCYSIWRWFLLRLQGAINRLVPLMLFPINRFGSGFLRRLRPWRWQGVKTCNLAVWRDDFLAVNGFDENYQGWGYEDSDLVIRLMKLGVKRIDGRFAAVVLHLWHPENDRSRTPGNYARLQDILQSKEQRCSLGVDQYLYLPKNEI